MVFLRDEGARAAIEGACRAEGFELGGWREVPVSPEALGDEARASRPAIEQLVLLRPEGLDDDALELRAYRARRRTEAVAGAYVASLSFRTVTYKALCAADHLADFYADLRDPALAAPFGIFHQRFSTNTGPTWERAQPFRLLCHNGEINAVRGNVNWMKARAGHLGFGDPLLDEFPLDESGSDSAILDNALEAVVRGGRDVRHAITMLVPESWELNPVMPEEIRDFYRYHAGLVEPWDGPAGIVFTDGRVVGATLDRNGLRPLRYAIVEGGLVACASEAGVVPLPDGGSGHARQARAEPDAHRRPGPRRGGEPGHQARVRAPAPVRAVVGRGHQARRPRRARRAARGGPDRAPGDGGIHARGDLADPPPDRHQRPRPGLVHGRRHGAAAARRPRAPAGELLPAGLRPGDEPGHRPPAGAAGHVAADAARRARAAALGGPRGGAAARAGELLPLPVGPRGAGRDDARRDVRRGRGPARGLRAPGRRGRRRRLSRGRAAAAQRRPPRGRPRAGPVPPRGRCRPPAPGRRGAAHARVARRRERRAARDAPLRHAARLRRRRDLPRARARDDGRARGGGQGRRRPSLARRGPAPLPRGHGGRDPQGHVQDGHLGRGQLPGRADLRRDRPRAGGRRPRLHGHAVAARRHRLRRARGGRRSGAWRRPPRRARSWRTPATSSSARAASRTRSRRTSSPRSTRSGRRTICAGP